MKIAAIANDALKKEAESKALAPGVEWIWVDPAEALEGQVDADAWFDLDFVPESRRIEQLSRLLPRPVVINSVVHTLKEIGQPFIRINAWPGFLGRNCCELAVSSREQEMIAGQLLEKMGWAYRFAPDIPGMISARIVAAIVNEAYYTLQDKVSTKEEIDTAMRLGTNYPLGPFEWSECIGLEKIDVLLTELNKADGRYAVAKALKQAVLD